MGGAGGAVPFPVVFFDGQCEIAIGDVLVHPTMDFKVFQSVLSSKIGITPKQFTVYVADSNNSRNRIPITSKVDFVAVSREKDCFILVVLKRSRWSRTRKGKNAESSSPVVAMKKEPPANAMLLRRANGGGNNLMEARVFTDWMNSRGCENAEVVDSIGAFTTSLRSVSGLTRGQFPDRRKAPVTVIWLGGK
ncbi:Nudix hydrolase [Hibiscus syriacus]|uniref:Nudix hydrolase n=1 Tax=Hibiscus syriacus TaxID=106335 RepID=A0A6A2Y0E2_HIBSY|nr:Nudix hydrolase [Hibiscus syriacus]